MIKIFSENEIYIEVENEIEKLLVPLIIEKGDLVEMLIVRNIFSKKEKKILDRKQVFASIRVEKVDKEKFRIIGKIEKVSDDRVSKGFHGENIELGKEIKINKKNKLSEISKLFLNKLENFKMDKLENIKKLISENQDKFISEINKIEENLKYGLIEKLFVCNKNFYDFLEKIKIALEKNSEIIILKDREFCEKLKIFALLRFKVY